MINQLYSRIESDFWQIVVVGLVEGAHLYQLSVVRRWITCLWVNGFVRAVYAAH